MENKKLTKDLLAMALYESGFTDKDLWAFWLEETDCIYNASDVIRDICEIMETLEEIIKEVEE